MESKGQIKIAPLIFAIVAFLVLVNIRLFDVHSEQVAFALLIFAAILWFSEAIPLALTSLLIPAVAILSGLAQPAKAFSEFANPVIFLFMGGFVLAGALHRHSIDKSVALKLISLAKGNFYWSSVLLMLSTSFLACWISNTSSTALILPLGLGMISLVKSGNQENNARFLMLGIAYAANIGGVITMVSSPPNAIGANILQITFTKWMLYSVPLFMITFPVMVVVLTLYLKPDRKMQVEQVQKEPVPDVARNRAIVPIFLITAILWSLQGVLSPILNISDGYNSVVAIAAIVLIFICRVLKWEEIMSSIQWDILFLFGGGLTLGSVILESGLGNTMMAGIAGMMNYVPFPLFLWIIIAFSIILTEFVSNTASAALLLPLLYVLAVQLKINPLLIVLPATFAVSYGFMLPVGTPPNALVYGTGLVPQKCMIKAGLVLNIVFSVILTAVFYLVSLLLK